MLKKILLTSIPGSYPTLSTICPNPPPTRAQLHTARRMERKFRPLTKLNQHLDNLDDLASRGFILVFTDGSLERFLNIGWVGGYSMFSEAGLELSDFVPLHMEQTINAAELLAALTALRLNADHPNVPICTGSAYAMLGVKGAARRWKINGWKGSSGPVSNVPLWCTRKNQN